jgi:hypothetical protein
MESAIFVSGVTDRADVDTSCIYSRTNCALRFSNMAAEAFKRENFGEHKDRRLTDPACTEQFLTNKSLPMRAVLCVSAYRKFAGLYDFSLLTATTDENLMNLQSRLDITGVSYENGLRVSRIFLESIGREKKQ